MSNKKQNGQFFTTVNPFDIDIFWEWYDLIPEGDKKVFGEPFAGSNNIVRMLRDLHVAPRWLCFDIEVQSINNAPDIEIYQRDTIQGFPEGFNVVITNPPYLAKNSATRSGLSFPYPEYDDLYKKCLEVMLQHCDYVAAIIPESFITSGLFHNRLYAVSSLTCKMFEDTECPVCLAMFTKETDKETVDDFYIYRQNTMIGTYLGLSSDFKLEENGNKWKFNTPDGTIGIRCIDGTKHRSIEFIPGSTIPSDKIKQSSRSLTRVSGLPPDIDLLSFIEKCNAILESYRDDTNDVFLTAFKGLRTDGMYRRRLDYKTAKMILNAALKDYQ